MHTETSEQNEVFVFYDGDCSVCTRAAALFTKYDRGRGIVRCIDFRTDREAESIAGVSLETLSASLHAKLPGSALLNGPEAIRAVLDALDHGWKARWTNWAIIRPIADRCYALFARHRLRFFHKKHACDGACGITKPTDHSVG